MEPKSQATEVNIFSYNRSSKSQGKELILAWFIGVIVFGGVGLHLQNSKSAPIGGWLFIILLIPFSIGMLYGSFRMIKADGYWNIELNETQLKWDAPSIMGEKPFTQEVSNMKEIVSESTAGDREEYRLVLKEGHDIRLSLNSGVPMGTLINDLKTLGVPHRHVSYKSRQKKQSTV